MTKTARPRYNDLVCAVATNDRHLWIMVKPNDLKTELFFTCITIFTGSTTGATGRQWQIKEGHKAYWKHTGFWFQVTEVQIQEGENIYPSLI